MTLSVVITTYNRAHLIQRAIASVLSEIEEDDEIIVIDDGSRDDTDKAVQQVHDPRIRYIWQPNGGPGSARNRGAREATKDLLAYLDSDDKWLPGRVAVQRGFMEARPDILFSATDFARDFDGGRHPKTMGCWDRDPNGWREAMGKPQKYSSTLPLPPGIADFDVYTGNIYRVQMLESYISLICLMVRRRETESAMHFTEKIALWDDWACFGRLGRLGKFAQLDFVGALQIAHDGPRLTDLDWVKRAESRLVVLRTVWGSDPEFLERHGDEYRALEHQQELLKLRSLILLGRTREARQEAKIVHLSAPYRALSRMPGNVVGPLVKLGRPVRRWIAAARH